jgi:hypothetical protein
MFKKLHIMAIYLCLLSVFILSAASVLHSKSTINKVDKIKIEIEEIKEKLAN